MRLLLMIPFIGRWIQQRLEAAEYAQRQAYLRLAARRQAALHNDAMARLLAQAHRMPRNQR